MILQQGLDALLQKHHRSSGNGYSIVFCSAGFTIVSRWSYTDFRVAASGSAQNARGKPMSGRGATSTTHENERRTA